MAAQRDVNQLLSGVAIGDPHQEFGVCLTVPSLQLRRGCRRKQALSHQDKGIPSEVSQLANACADVLCGRVPMLGDETIETASRLLVEVRQRTEQAQYTKLMQEWRERDKQARIERVTTPEHKEKALLFIPALHV